MKSMAINMQIPLKQHFVDNNSRRKAAAAPVMASALSPQRANSTTAPAAAVTPSGTATSWFVGLNRLSQLLFDGNNTNDLQFIPDEGFTVGKNIMTFAHVR